MWKKKQYAHQLCYLFIPLSSIFIFVTIYVSKDRQNTLNCIHVHVDIRRNISSDCDLIVNISRPKGRRKRAQEIECRFMTFQRRIQLKPQRGTRRL